MNVGRSKSSACGCGLGGNSGEEEGRGATLCFVWLKITSLGELRKGSTKALDAVETGCAGRFKVPRGGWQPEYIAKVDMRTRKYPE